MEVTFEEACNIYNLIDVKNCAPAFSPEYVLVDAQRHKDFKPTFFVYREDEAVFYHAFHRCKIPGTDYTDIQSPYGYGGPLVNTTSYDFMARANAAYLQWSLEHNIIVEFLRFHPLTKNWLYYQGETFFNRDTVWLNLKVADLFALYKSRVRTEIRKAYKNGLVVRFEEPEKFLKEFSFLYKQRMIALQAEEEYLFSHQYLKSLVHLKGTLLAVAEKDNCILAAAIFLFNNDIAEYHLSASNELGQKWGGTNVILHEVAEHCRKNNLAGMHLGGGVNTDPNNSLLFFKKGFSELQSSYFIGKRIFNPKVYATMREEWKASHGNISSKVLFYR